MHGYLTGEGYRVSTAHDGAEMRRIMAQGGVDLVILDLMLPGEDGLTLARSASRGSSVGIIILTGRGEIVDRIIGLEMGADDYLPKPFHLRELLARVKSVLRRASEPRRREAGGAPIAGRFSGWNLDLASRELLSPSGEEVRLTTGEFDLLAAFVNNANQVLTRDRLLDLARNREAGPVRPNNRRPGRAAAPEARGRSAAADDDQNRARQQLHLHPDSRGDLRQKPPAPRPRRFLLRPSDSRAPRLHPYPRGGQRPRPRRVA